MVVKNPEANTQENSLVELAIAAVERVPAPLDADMGDVDDSPTCLSLDGDEEAEACCNPRCTRHAVDDCIICGHAF